MFTREEIALLAQCERDMDSGKMPFVVLGGNRWGSSQECLDALGLISGQTVNLIIIQAMLRWKIDDCKAKIEEQKFQESHS